MKTRSSARKRLLRRGVLGVGGLSILLAVGCARLEPMIEPEVADLQVTIDTLKSAVREAQRTAGDLRTELEEQRKELADAQLARAQLEGMLRETERRLAEARQIIELQREELASARVERERVAQAGRQLQSRMRQFTRVIPPHATMSMTESEGVAPASLGVPPSAEVVPLPPVPGAEVPMPAAPAQPPVVEEPQASASRTIVVADGDTLWRLSRRHKVDLGELRMLNGLRDYRIIAGRTLRLPDPRGGHATGAEATNGASR
mgnify:FL=1